jgi:hypothetical protein
LRVRRSEALQAVLGDAPAEVRTDLIRKPVVETCPHARVHGVPRRNSREITWPEPKGGSRVTVTVNEAGLTGPANRSSTCSAAPAKPAWPLGYSGPAGVGTSEVQSGSATVSGSPSVSAARIAVTGRHSRYLNLASPTAIRLSIVVVVNAARSRTFHRSGRPESWTSGRNAGMYALSDDWAHSHAISVWSWVRSVEVALPSRCTSSRSRR